MSDFSALMFFGMGVALGMLLTFAVIYVLYLMDDLSDKYARGDK